MLSDKVQASSPVFLGKVWVDYCKPIMVVRFVASNCLANIYPIQKKHILFFVTLISL